MPQYTEFSKYASQYGSQMPTNTHIQYGNFPLPLATQLNTKASFIVQPQQPRSFGKLGWWNDYYMSLKLAEEARFYRQTYAANNLRFNRLRRSQL